MNNIASKKKITVSVIIRTYNESRYLDQLLCAIEGQERINFDIETVLVDSGSTDGTLDIALRHQVKIVHIKKADFTFGRSLNMGCDAASGEILVLISGHCIPVNNNWLVDLIKPLVDDGVSCSYGRQIGGKPSKFSEIQLFNKYYPSYSKKNQDGFFCNNANAAVARSSWATFRYNESLTGLEDMYLGRQLTEAGESISYVATAGVYHIHDEGWRQIKVRYEREALALQQILPNVHFGIFDLIVYTLIAVSEDLKAAVKQGKLFKEIDGILRFRVMQYWGTYVGARRHRLVSDAVKHSYFYPKDVDKEKYVATENHSFASNESK